MSSQEWSKKFISAAFWSSLLVYFFSAVNFILQIFLARMLAPKLFGIYAFALAVRELFYALLSFNNNKLFVQSPGGQNDFNTSVFIACLAAIGMLVLGSVGSVVLYFLDGWRYALMLFLVCSGYLLTILAMTHIAPLEKELNFKKAILIQNGSVSFGAVCAVIAVSLGASLWGLALREILQGLFFFACAFYVAKFRFNWRGPFAGFRQQMSFGFKTLFSDALNILYERFPAVLIKLFSGVASVAYFYQARYLAYLPIRLSEPFTRNIFFSYAHGIKDDRQKLQQHLFWLNYAVTLFLFPALVIVFLFGAKIFTFVYGAKWQIAGEYFRWLAFFIYLCPVFTTLASVCYSLKKQQFISQAYVCAIAVFVLGFVFTDKGYFAAISFSAGLFVACLFAMLRLRLLGIKVYTLRLFALPAVMMVLIMFLYYSHLSLVKMLLSVGLILLVFYLLELKTILRLLASLKRIRSA